MTIPSNSQPFDATGFIKVAKALPHEQGSEYPKEARVRSAVGRAYYGLFLAVRRKICVAQSRDIDSNIGHGSLKNALFDAATRHSDTGFNVLAQVLDTLYEARRAADYKFVLDARYAANLRKPAYGDQLARQAEDQIVRLDKLAFDKIDSRLLTP